MAPKTATNKTSSNSKSGSTTSTIQLLADRRDQLSQKIEQLQLQLDEAKNERFDIDTEIQRLHFAASSSGVDEYGDGDNDKECAALKSSFESLKSQFEQSCLTPRDFDSDVPHKCSDDFADTSAFDDWTDQQLEVFSGRLEKVISVAELEQSLLLTESNNNSNNGNNTTNNSNEQVLDSFLSGVESALRILFRTTESINSMVETVSKVEGADVGILLECRDLLMEHWHAVLGDESLIGKSPLVRAEGVDERFTKFFQLKPDFGEMLCNELERVGKPFSLLVAVAEKETK